MLTLKEKLTLDDINKINNNLPIKVDSYKTTHKEQYDPTTEITSYYISPRKVVDRSWQERVVFFGLQRTLMKFLSKPVTKEDVDFAKAYFDKFNLGHKFDRSGWDFIVDCYNGKLPIEIKAIEEGTRARRGIPVIRIENTEKEAAWLPGYLETLLLRVWDPCTIATNSFNMKKMIWEYCQESCDEPEFDIMFKLHDFGARACSGSEEAGIAAMAHLTSFYGTDTIEGSIEADLYYGDLDGSPSGSSVCASEHSTMMSWGKDKEVEAYRNMIKQFGDTGLFATVFDTYNCENAIRNIVGGELRNDINNMNSTLVVRTDSGNPVTVPIKAIEILLDKFGYTVNNKGFKVINKTKVLHGDKVSSVVIKECLEKLIERKISVQNLNFGCGGELLRNGKERDTYGFSCKLSATNKNGIWEAQRKTPVGEEFKKSLAGRLCVIENKDSYMEYDIVNSIVDEDAEKNNILKTVYLNGKITKTTTLEDVRKRLNSYIMTN